MTIGVRLKEERNRVGANQSVFAEKCGVTKNTQLAYEKGERSPDAAYLERAASLGVDVLYVVTGNRASVTADSLTIEESEVLNHYRSMPEIDRAAVRRMSAALAESAGRYVVNSDK